MSYVNDNSTSELWKKIKEKLEYTIATSSSAGLMSSSDVGKLNELEAALEAKQGTGGLVEPDILPLTVYQEYVGGTSAKTFDGETIEIDKTGNGKMVADNYSSADWKNMNISLGYRYGNNQWEECYQDSQTLGSSFPNVTYYLWWDVYGYDEYYVTYIRTSSGSNYLCSVRVQNYSSEYMVGSSIVTK